MTTTMEGARAWRRAWPAIAGVLVGSTAACCVAAAEMSFERALNVQNEPQNWLLHHHNYAGHRYSALGQINSKNVGKLRLAFAIALGDPQGGGRYAVSGLEGTPIVEDGMLYVTDGWGAIYKIDGTAGTRGRILWKYDPGTDRAWAGDVACCGVNNRGVALWKDMLISPVLDGRILAVSKGTGDLVWERQVADPAIGETITSAPLVIRDLGISGMAGGELGVRGWLDATDLNTGKRAWRTHTVPANGEPGNETWLDDHDAWMHGGAAPWVTGTYDVGTNLTYWGTGNAGPDYDPDYRPGDNKWAASVLAFDATSGAIAWGFQYTPNDPFDYDEASEHPLIDVTVDGRARKLIVHAARNGIFYALDRTDGAFLHAKPYVDKVTWTTGVDPVTGKPLTYDPRARIQTYAPGSHGTRANPIGVTCPAVVGGTNWQPSAYSPTLRLLYVGSVEGCQQIETRAQDHFKAQGGKVSPRDRFTGGSPQWRQRPVGSIKAIDVLTGDVRADLRLPFPNFSGVLATAGNLVFTGEFDGTFHAMDGLTMKELWSFNIGTGINAPAVTYAVNGKQYVAALVGSRMSALVIGLDSEFKNSSPASILVVFSL